MKLTEKENAFYQIGKRDAVAEILMIVRDKGNVKYVIENIAHQLLKIEPNHPHAKWVLDNLSTL